MKGQISRDQIADRLLEAAQLLEAQGADRFRVRAYRRGAETIRALHEDPADILEREGLEGLIELPNIGNRLARAVDEMVATGRWIQLERMRGEAEPEKLFQMVPGIGAVTARSIQNELHVDTLEALEIAAHDGRLELVQGIGPRRAASIRAQGTVWVCLFNAAEFERMLAAHPAVAIRLVKLIRRRSWVSSSL